MKKLDFFWKTNKSWYFRDTEGGYFLKEEAPEEAKKSYKHYLEQLKEILEDERNGLLD